MGTSNFKSTAFVGVSFGLEEPEQNPHEIGAIKNEVDLFVDQINKDNDFLFHSLKVDLGYDDGFQVYVVQEMSGQDIFDSTIYGGTNQDPDHEVVHFIDKNGYEVVEGRVDMANLAYVELTRLPNGEESYLLVKNKDAMNELVASEHKVLMHHLAIVADECGLRVIEGGGSLGTKLSRDDIANQKLIDSFIIPELIEANDQNQVTRPTTST